MEKKTEISILGHIGVVQGFIGVIGKENRNYYVIQGYIGIGFS